MQCVRSGWGVVAAGLVALAAGTPAIALAEETPLDFTVCRSGTVHLLEQSKEALVLAIDISGVVVSANDKRFDSMTTRCYGVGSVISGKRVGTGYCKFLDKDGDTNVLSYTASADKPGAGTWEYVYGSGKWAGIKGKGDFYTATSGKPLAPGTYQACNRVTAKFSLPK
jgi:hypothetical protein